MKFTKIVKKEHKHYKGKVYDLTVEDSHSYNIDNLIVHNSGAGSLVCYTSGITKVDPIEYDLLFERFLNPDRGHLPDIDADFDVEQGYKVFKHINEKYGKDYCSNIITFQRMKIKSIIKDLARCLDVDFVETNDFTSKIPNKIDDKDVTFEILFEHPDYKGFFDKYPLIKKFAPYYENMPRATSQHPAGIGISSIPIKDISPVLLSKDSGEEEMYLSIFEKENYEIFGFVKYDILKLENVTDLRHMVNMANKLYNLGLTEEKIPIDDKKTWQLICNLNTFGVFQFASPVGIDVLKKVQPINIEELSACNSFIRPGASGLDEYINGKKGKEIKKYEPRIDKILEKTFGAIVYQEQIMSLISELIGVSFGKADIYRRALEKPKKGKNPQLIQQFNEDVKVKAVERGYKPEIAEEIRKLIVDSSGYSFNKCLSGREKLYRDKNKYFHPTIEEMYLIKNDKEYAKQNDNLSLHKKYNRQGYGKALSMNEQGRLIQNTIKNITFSGIMKVYKVTMEDGKTVECTMNHKFPTPNGEKLLSELQVGDLLYVKDKYENQIYIKNYKKACNLPKKGQQGFQHITSNNLKLFKEHRQYCQDNNLPCEICGNLGEELHHKDGNNQNNMMENFAWLCISCHKKEHYKMGRTKKYKKGLLTKLIKIKSIEFVCEENTYNVEMEHPYHNFLTNNGIVVCNSHAVCYSLISYQTAWFKANYPLIFYTVMINSCDDQDIMTYLNEAKKAGIEVLPPDVNKSDFKSKIENNKAIRIGFNSLKGIGEAAANKIVDAQPITNIKQLIENKVINKTGMEVLINTNALVNLPITDEIQQTLTPIQIELYLKLLETTDNSSNNYAVPAGLIKSKYRATYDFIEENDKTIIIPGDRLEEFAININKCKVTKKEPKGFLKQEGSSNDKFTNAFIKNKEEILNTTEKEIKFYLRSKPYINFPLFKHPLDEPNKQGRVDKNNSDKLYFSEFEDKELMYFMGIVESITKKKTKTSKYYYLVDCIGVRESITIQFWEEQYNAHKDKIQQDETMYIRGSKGFGRLTVVEFYDKGQ